MLHSENFSIGEEQSLSTVVALAWSPPGLAKHKRPTLAVLTSNHLLSLWASNSNMAVRTSWERVLIVNHAIRKQLPATTSSEPKDDGEESFEPNRLQRLRCMAWAPLLVCNNAKVQDSHHVAHHVDPSERTPNQENRSQKSSRTQADLTINDLPADFALASDAQLLAAADDCGGIYIIQISSPSSYQSDSWGCEVLQYRSFPSGLCGAAESPQEHRHPNGNLPNKIPVAHEAGPQTTARPSLLAMAFAGRDYIDTICWSSWRANSSGEEAEATITITNVGVTRHLKFWIRYVAGHVIGHSINVLEGSCEVSRIQSELTSWCQLV